MERKVLKASEGMVLTNGEVYGKTVYLAEDADESVFYEITEEENRTILESEAKSDENMCR